MTDTDKRLEEIIDRPGITNISDELMQYQRDKVFLVRLVHTLQAEAKAARVKALEEAAILCEFHEIDCKEDPMCHAFDAAEIRVLITER